MLLKRLILVWAAVLAVALLGAARATAGSAPIWNWNNFLGLAASQQIQAPGALAVGDLDGNGWEDYVVADRVSNTLHVLLFADSPVPGVGTSLVYATGNDPSSVAIGDLNGDSIRDLVVANAGDGTITVRLRLGLAGFLLAKLITEPNVGEYRRFRMNFVNGLATPIRTNPRPRPECVFCGREVMRTGYAARWGSVSA